LLTCFLILRFHSLITSYMLSSIDSVHAVNANHSNNINLLPMHKVCMIQLANR